MREYIITMSVAALVCSVLEIFAPKEWEKYIKLAIGFLILSIIISPVAKFRHAKILPQTPSYEIKAEEFYDGISKELKNRVEDDIVQRLKDEFDVKAKVEVDIDVDENHNIKGVNAIRVRTWQNPKGMIERLEEIYGCSRIEIKLE